MNRESKSGLILFCALAAIAAPAAAQPVEPIGRLFFTPAQRASLDVARTRRAQTTLASEKSEDSTPAAQSVTYDGMVRRSDGKSTIWINGRPFNESEQTSGPVVGRIRQDGGILLQLPQSGRSVELKVGQTVELQSGTIEEAYSRRPVRPEPKPAAKPGADAKPAAKPGAPDRAAEERNREEREQQRVEEAVSRALQESTGAKPGAVPPSPPAERSR